MPRMAPSTCTCPPSRSTAGADQSARRPGVRTLAATSREEQQQGRGPPTNPEVEDVVDARESWVAHASTVPVPKIMDMLLHRHQSTSPKKGRTNRKAPETGRHLQDGFQASPPWTPSLPQHSHIQEPQGGPPQWRLKRMNHETTTPMTSRACPSLVQKTSEKSITRRRKWRGQKKH